MRILQSKLKLTVRDEHLRRCAAAACYQGTGISPVNTTTIYYYILLYSRSTIHYYTLLYTTLYYTLLLYTTIVVPNREWWPLKLVVVTPKRPRIGQKLLIFCSFLAFLHYYHSAIYGPPIINADSSIENKRSPVILTYISPPVLLSARALASSCQIIIFQQIIIVSRQGILIFYWRIRISCWRIIIFYWRIIIFIIRILSAFYYPHIIRILLSAFYYPHFIIRISYWRIFVSNKTLIKL